MPETIRSRHHGPLLADFVAWVCDLRRVMHREPFGRSIKKIEAIGTEFNIRTERITTVAVLDGAVNLYARGSTGQERHNQSSTRSSANSRLSAGQAMI